MTIKKYNKTYLIKDNVYLGEGAIIQAGSIVVKDIPKYAIIGGHFAKVFSERYIKHYLFLKESKQFH